MHVGCRLHAARNADFCRRLCERSYRPSPNYTPLLSRWASVGCGGEKLHLRRLTVFSSIGCNPRAKKRKFRPKRSGAAFFRELGELAEGDAPILTSPPAAPVAATPFVTRIAVLVDVVALVGASHVV